MQPTMTTSGYVTVGACMVVALWDLIVVRVFKWPLTSTVSWFIHNQACIHPSLLIAIGYLLGHFFAAM